MTPAITETDLGREVRQNVARILKRFEGCDIAAVKVVDLQKIDRLINPEPETFRIPVERETPAYAALRQAGIDRIIERDEAVSAGGR
jgi:hypothetical protein